MRPVQESPKLITVTPQSFAGIINSIASIVKQLLNVLSEFGFRLNRVLPKDGSEPMTGPLPLATYTVATQPDPTQHAGAIIYVSNGIAGTRFRGSDGTSWVALG